MALEQYANAPIPSSPSTPWTTLSAGVDAVTTTIPVYLFAPFPSAVQFRILIDDEWMLVTGGAGSTSWTVTRGVEGSTAAVHALGAGVFHVLTKAGFLNNPLALTTSGDISYLNASLNQARLAAPGDGVQAISWTAGVPSWVAAVTATSATAFTNKTGNISQWTNDSSYLTSASLANYVVGPALAVDNSIARFNGTTGKIIQDYTSGAPTIGDTGVATIPSGVIAPTLVSPDAAGLLRLNGTVTPTGVPNYISTLVMPNIVNAASHSNEISIASVSDGYAYSGWEGAFIAQAGDQEPIAGAPAIPGEWYGIGFMYTQYNDTTDRDTLNLILGLGIDYNAYKWAFVQNAVGDLALGRADVNTASPPPYALTGNLRIDGATGNVTILGTVTATDFILSGGAVLATQTYVNAQGFVTASSAAAFTNKTGAISQWTNDASYTTLAAVAGVGYLTTVTAHNVLSATHGDTLAASVVRGSLIVGNDTPKWSALAIGAAATILSSDGTDATWVAATGTGSPVRATSPTLVTPTLGVATGTRLGLGVAADAAIPLVVRGAGATSATFSFVVEDSAGVDALAVRNDGRVAIGPAAVNTGTSAASLLMFGTDFSGAVIFTNTVNGSSAPVNLFAAEIRFAGTQEYTRAYGAELTAQSTNTHTANVIGGALFRAMIGSAGGRAAALVGGEFQAKTNDATGGTVTTIAGGKFSASVSHASVIGTSVYGVWVPDLTNSGTITNTYGIYVGDMTTGTQTNQAYNLYLSDVNARNLLSGNTSIVGDLTLSAKNLITDTTTGMKIGTATTQKIAFYNSNPIVQGASVADATGGAIIDAEGRAAINALISRIEAVGLIATV